MAVVRVGVRGRLASPGRRVVGERDPERATFPWVERMYLAGHAGRYHPCRDCARIEKRAIDDRAGRVHVATDAVRTHARTLALAASTGKNVEEDGGIKPREKDCTHHHRAFMTNEWKTRPSLGD